MTRIAVAGFSHETNTFAQGLTTFDDFVRGRGFPGLMTGQALVRSLTGTATCTGAFLDAAEELGFEMLPLLWTFPQPSGLIEQGAYDRVLAMLLEELEAALPVDGVLLQLHGAMVTEQLEDAEGDILTRVREIVGPEVPVMATLDLHANISPLMVQQADALVGYDTYPHVDAYQRGRDAARLLMATMEGRVEPVAALAQVPMLIGPPRQCTLMSPMSDIIDLAHEAEGRSGILNVTVAGGFPFADIADCGAAVVVTADGDADLADAAAQEIAGAMWDRRDDFRVRLTPLADAIDHALRTGEGPVVLADGSDNPGGGAPCDGTVMLQALIEANAPRSTVAIIADAEAVAQAIKTGVGQQVTLQVGGKTDDRHGPTLTLTGYVRLISDGRFANRGPMYTGVEADMGRTVVFVVGEVEVVLTEQRIQPYDCEALRSVGIEPRERLLIGLKSAVHFRADYGPLASAIFEVDTPGIHNPDVTRLQFQRLRRPIWPLDDIEDLASAAPGQTAE
ncbi:MAG: M81 family metallopeptidase [Armatimonadota bacterium]|nr:M81 family metallopeptidase [Armatimonadota bacterium]